MEKQMIEEIAVDLSKVQMPTTLDKKTWNLANELIRELLMAEYEFKRQEVKDISFLPFFVVRLAEKGYIKQEWFSVEDRLPQENEKVLAINSDGEIFIATYLVHKISPSARGYTTWASGLWNGTPTHWQPLPQPPKMRGE